MALTYFLCQKPWHLFFFPEKKIHHFFLKSTPKEVFTEIKKTLAVNQAKRVKTLKDIKERKFILLKYHSNSSTPRPTQQYSNGTTIQNEDHPSCSNALQRRPSQQRLSRRSSGSNIIQGKQQGRLTRRNSRNNLQGHQYNGANNTKHQYNRSSNIEHQINDLEKQIKTLRQQTQQDSQRQTHFVNNNNAVNTKITNQPKNWERDPSPGGSTTNNEQTIDSRLHLHIYANINRIRKTIKSTTTYKFDPFELAVNASNFNFSISVYKLLGKNLNFCPTPKLINKNILQKELHNFFRRIKLRAHFGISEEKEKGPSHS